MFDLHTPSLNRGRLVEISGLPATTINNWNAAGRLPLYAHAPGGSGRPRLYTRGEAIACSVVAALDRVGASRDWTPVLAHTVISKVEELEGDEPMRRLDGTTSLVIENPFPLMDKPCLEKFGYLLSEEDAAEYVAHRLPSVPVLAMPFGSIVNRANADFQRIVGRIE
ncbi:hypothetical protein [Rhodosalinus sp. K401]|uniref:hypothetical protein n=1 Tax=Rhodosalinus sp. K401 TaxID=3239195 RepID=UPI003523DB52